jgi:hypothetical protein
MSLHRQRPHRWAAAAALLLAATPAWADRSEGPAFSLSFVGGSYSLNDLALSPAPAADEPDVLRDSWVKLDGTGRHLGGALRGLMIGDEVHAGLGIGMYSVQELRLRSGALPDGLRIAPDAGVFGMGFELFLGHTVDLETAHPYLELRAALNVVSAEVQLHSRSYGLMGTTQYNAFAYTLGPRLGIAIPMGRNAYLDIAADAGLGAERFGVRIGLGYKDGRWYEPRTQVAEPGG